MDGQCVTTCTLKLRSWDIISEFILLEVIVSTNEKMRDWAGHTVTNNVNYHS